MSSSSSTGSGVGWSFRIDGSYCLLIPFGAVAKVNLVWAWGDLMNALQIFPNLIGVLALSGIAAKAARERPTRSRPRGLEP